MGRDLNPALLTLCSVFTSRQQLCLIKKPEQLLWIRLLLHVVLILPVNKMSCDQLMADLWRLIKARDRAHLIDRQLWCLTTFSTCYELVCGQVSVLTLGHRQLLSLSLEIRNDKKKKNCLFHFFFFINLISLSIHFPVVRVNPEPREHWDAGIHPVWDGSQS